MLSSIVTINKLNYDKIEIEDSDIIAFDLSLNKKTSYLYGFDIKKLLSDVTALAKKHSIFFILDDINLSAIDVYKSQYPLAGVILQGTYTNDFLATLKAKYKDLCVIVCVDSNNVLLDRFFKIYGDFCDYFLVTNFSANTDIATLLDYAHKIYIEAIDAMSFNIAQNNNFKGLVRLEV